MMSILRLPIVRAAAFVLPLVVVGASCEDSESAAQRRLTKQVEDAIIASTKALPGGRLPDEPEKALAAATQLRSLAQGLSSNQGGSPAQRSAAALLAANLTRKAAEIDLVLAADTEAAHRMERLAVSRAAAAAAGLDALAGPLDRIDFAAARTQLKSQRELAEGQLRQLQTQVKTLESAVAQVDRQLADTEKEAARLEAEAEQLRAQAQSLRPRQALPYIEQAAELRIRNADLRGELGMRQSERSALAPQLAGAKALGQGGASMLEVTDSAISDLQGLSEKAREAAARARRGASEIRASAKTRLEAVLTAMAGELQARYDATVAGFEKSAQLAQQAGSGTDSLASDSAALAKASAQLGLAQAMAQRAVAMSDHAALITQINALGGWGEQSQLAPEAKKASDSAAEALAKAKEQYAAAVESLEALRNPSLKGSADVNGLKAKAQRALAELERPGSTAGADAAAATGGAGGSGASGGAVSGGSGGGAPTVEELVARLNAAAGDPGAMSAAMALFRSAKNPKLVAAMASMGSAMEPVMIASKRKFGKALDTAGGMGGGMAGGMGVALPTAAKLINSGADNAELELATPKGPMQVKAVKTDGAWYLDFDAMLEAAAPGSSERASAAAPMLEAMAMGMSAAATSIAARIDAGEFSTPEEAAAALQQEMMKVLGPAMQGAAGAGSRGAGGGGAP